MWWMLFMFYSGSYNLSITLLSVSPLQQSLFYSLSDAGAFAHVIEMYFLVCSVCMWMIPCAIKVPSDALLVTTLKKHMSAAVMMCCGYSAFWGFCGLGFSEFLKVLLWGLGGFVVVAYFACEGIFSYWNLLSIESFCGIKLHCSDQEFPCWMQEGGLDGFLRFLQHFISAALYFYWCWGVGAIQEVLICAEWLPVNYSLYFAIWLPDN